MFLRTEQCTSLMQPNLTIARSKKAIGVKMESAKKSKMIDEGSRPGRPETPLPTDCCGGGCNPCIMDVYASYLAAWELGEQPPVEFRGQLLSTVKYLPFKLTSIEQLTEDANLYTFEAAEGVSADIEAPELAEVDNEALEEPKNTLVRLCKAEEKTEGTSQPKTAPGASRVTPGTRNIPSLILEDSSSAGNIREVSKEAPGSHKDYMEDSRTPGGSKNIFEDSRQSRIIPEVSSEVLATLEGSRKDSTTPEGYLDVPDESGEASSVLEVCSEDSTTSDGFRDAPVTAEGSLDFPAEFRQARNVLEASGKGSTTLEGASDVREDSTTLENSTTPGGFSDVLEDSTTSECSRITIFPGQHVILRSPDASLVLSRPYTPISHTARSFTLVIRLYPLGAMSAQLATLFVGARLYFRGPYGTYRYQVHREDRLNTVLDKKARINSLVGSGQDGLRKPRGGSVVEMTVGEGQNVGRSVGTEFPRRRKLLLLAAGTGLAPLYAVARAALADDATTVHLLYSVRRLPELLLRESLYEMSHAWNFTAVYHVTGGGGVEGRRWRESCVESRIGEGEVRRAVKGREGEDVEVLVCGTQGFNQAMKGYLEGVRAKVHVFEE